MADNPQMSDPSFMDMMVASQYGPPMPGAQGQPRANMQPYMSQNPMAASMIGSSLPQNNELSSLMPGHPRLGAALDNASLAMSMIPTGMTTGENIKNVSGAMTELPYARLAHAYQMLNPGMQYQTAGAQLNLLQAQREETLGRGEYYSGRNLASVESMRDRDQRAQLLRSLSGKPQYGLFPAAQDDPQGRWKKGENVYGQFQDDYVEDKQGEPGLKRSFVPVMTEPEATSRGMTTGGVSNMKNANQLGTGLANLLTGYYINNEGMSFPEAAKRAEGIVQNPAMQRAVFGQGATDTRQGIAEQNATAKTVYTDELNSLDLPKNQGDKLVNPIMAYALYKRQLQPGQQPMSSEDFSRQYTDQQESSRQALEGLYSKWSKLKSPDRPDFKDYLNQQGYYNTGSSRPTGSTAKNYDPSTGTIR